MRSWLAVAAIAVATTLAPGVARADAADARRQALDLFDQGKAAYQEGRFADAVDLLSRAYAIEPAPVLLYNMARAYEGAGDFPEAIDAYERYLAQAKTMPDRPAIEARVESLRKTVAEKERLARERDEANARRARAPAAEARPGDVPREPPSAPSPAPWIVTGAGAAGLVAGAIVGAVALGRHGDAEDAPDQRRAFDLQSSAEDLGVASTVLFIAGGAVGAIGLTWGIVDVASSGEASGEASLELVFTATGAALRGAF